MKKIIKIAAAVLIVLALIFAVIYLPANAASSSSIAISSKSVKIGDALTVTVRINGGEAMYATEASLNYDANIFRFNSGDMATGGSGSVHIVGTPGGAQSQSYALNFTAISAGTGSFSLVNVSYVGVDQTSVTGASVTGITVTDGSTNSSSPSTPSTPSTVTPSSPSSNANLSSLKVSGAALSPSFSAGRIEYTASVANNIEKVTISANVADGGATFTGAGTYTLKVGDNDYYIVVTAADGKTKKTYHVNVKRLALGEEPEVPADPLSVVIDGEERRIFVDIASVGSYAGYSVSTVDRSGTQVNVLADDNGKYTLYYLTDTAGNNGGYYTLDDSGSFTKVNYIKSNGKLYIIEDFDSDLTLPSGYSWVRLLLDCGDVTAIQSDDKSLSDFYIICCYCEGASQFYRYDKAENILQRAPDFKLGDTVKVSEQTDVGFFERLAGMTALGKTVLGLIVIGIIAIIALAVLLVIRFTRGGSQVSEHGNEENELMFDITSESSPEAENDVSQEDEVSDQSIFEQDEESQQKSKPESEDVEKE